MTLSETLVAMAVGSVMLTGLMITSTNLQRWFSSADYAIACQQDQAVALDYITRDIRRASAIEVGNGDRKLTLTLPDQTVRAADKSLAVPAIGSTGAVQYGSAPSTVSYFVQGTDFVRQSGAATLTLSKNIDEFHTDFTAPPQVALTLVFKAAPRRSTGLQAVAKVNWRNSTARLQ